MGKLAEIKTRQTEASVEDFLKNIADEQMREDSRIILDMMKKATKEEPKIWGKSIVGFGNLVYKSPATGREVAWFRIGFAPRKGNLSLHLVGDIRSYGEALEKLGKHKTGMGCLYIKKLSDVDLKVLEKMIKAAAKKK